uniref:DUF4110 domain-containing protein n=1 Tax=Trypanosoma vivax (strain Y486) TaxID=1055687 RepID=G0TW19_TRYVY|nr:conserved hypothetical protein, fragment [Trypanosoma vivax Y486]
MGKGRDKRKRHEDPEKAAKRASRQMQKLMKGRGQAADEKDTPAGFNNEEAPEVTLSRIRKAESKARTTLEQRDLPPPSPRANVVFSAHPERENELLIFGGEYWDGARTVVYNDLFFYNLKHSSWSRLVTAINPPPRSSSQGFVYKHFFFIHGGEFVSQSQSQFLHFRDVWRFDTRKFEWEELKTLKGGPSSRSGHRMCMWRRNAVLFGGFYDNAMECRYYNDLWVLSELDSVGKWAAVKTPPQSEAPHPRSGHCMAVYDDTVFVYGGYSAEKFNRFKKTQATVHHDLWMIRLQLNSDVGGGVDKEQDRGSLSVWTKVRLGGIPPPIRSGVSCAFRDRKMYLFGGVVDIESPGGKMISSFSNDLFIFHMDTKRFYPVVLRAKRSTNASPAANSSAARAGAGNLEEELKALQIQSLASDADSCSSSENDADDAGSDGADGDVDVTQLKESFEVNKCGQVLPYRRMDAATLIVGNVLYVFGGQFECGTREVTMSDLFALNLNTCDTYRVLLSHDLSSAKHSSVSFAVDDGDEAPQAIPAELDEGVTPGREEMDGITTVKGKKGLKVHKEQLLAQLSTGCGVPVPMKDESASQFFERTSPFWMSMAEESFKDVCGAKQQSERRIRKEASRFASRRYRETKKLLEQLRLVEEREVEEARFFRELREQKEKEWEAYERQLAMEEEKEEEEEEKDEVES